MPYINRNSRADLDIGLRGPETAGELNYCITKLVDAYIAGKDGVSYQNVNEVVGVLECAKLELYRRVAAPYEDVKLAENGEVYSVICKSCTEGS